jgi:penicillin-binding protein 1B
LTAAALAALVAAELLFDKLERVTTNRALRLPAQFFADVKTVRAGDALAPDTLVRWLADRGYAGQSAAEPAPGRYRRSGAGIEVNFRRFAYPDGRVLEGPHRIGFRDGEAAELEGPGGKLAELRLPPRPLGDLVRDGAEHRPWTALEQVPPLFRRTLLASEDKRFYTHFGVDPAAVVRALRVNLARRGARQGGSTLTQQLVKNVFLKREKTLRRKALEALLALLMEARYDKDAILEMYLNRIYLGREGLRGLYGVEDASRAFFGKPAARLTAGETALLVGMIPAPNAFHPRAAPAAAKRRRDRVLGLMLHEKLISAAEWRAALGEPVVLTPTPLWEGGNYYAAWARQSLERKFTAAALDGQDYRVYLAMDLDLQDAAEKAVARQALPGALVAVDPRDGSVKALVGGRDYRTNPFNRAVLARRHPGSAFKPFLYAAALENRAATLATLLADEPLTITRHGRSWSSQNYDGKFRGTVTVREALVHSLNVPSVRLLERVAPERVIALARACGIASPLHPVPSLALGTSEVTPLELTAAYAPFANGGEAAAPVAVLWVTDSHGRVLYEERPQRRPAFSPGTAALMADVLQDVIASGTGRGARALGVLGPAGGKTGTSDDFLDAWFVGFTPELVCGVWLGYDKPASLGSASSRLALPVWADFMKAAFPAGSAAEFPEAPEVARKRIDPANGLLARAGCPVQKTELFLFGTEPVTSCGVHRAGVGGLFDRFRRWLRKGDGE